MAATSRPASNKQPMVARPESPNPRQFITAFSVVFGLFLGLCLLKFGNPPIMEKFVNRPADIYEFLFAYPWPIAWAYRLLSLVTILGIACVLVLKRSEDMSGEQSRSAHPCAPNGIRPRWLVALPAAWLLWQVVATAKSVDPNLSGPTLTHFLACVTCFYLGLFALGKLTNLWPFWLGVLAAFMLVLTEGWEQHFGGLKETRRYFMLYIYPTMKEVPPEYLKKMSSDRIFATMFYPNALAGVLLLLLPPTLGLLMTCQKFTFAARSFLAAVVGLLALMCLFWSGSKGGWLLMLLLGLLAFLKVPVRRHIKIAIIAAVLVLGLAGFFVRYLGFFQKGATSVSARFDYWRAAVQTAGANPMFGTGPGTFSLAYQKLKRPESEMSRLTHNDYLEQASDSGVPGFLTYTITVFGCLFLGFKRGAFTDWRTFTLWLGLLGWFLQGTMEFGLYLPALAWPAFTLLGFLLSRAQPSQKSSNNVIVAL